MCSISGKKCTYGVKCKFYHPERTHQSHSSLADELREKARLSSEKEDRNPMMSHLRGPQADPGSFPSYSLENDLEHRLTLEHRGSLREGPKSQVTENMLLYWDGPRSSRNQQARSPTAVGQGQMDWPSMLSPSTTTDLPYASISHECLDSGFGSYESQSQYSDVSQGHSKAFRPGSSRASPLVPDIQAYIQRGWPRTAPSPAGVSIWLPPQVPSSSTTATHTSSPTPNPS